MKRPKTTKRNGSPRPEAADPEAILAELACDASVPPYTRGRAAEQLARLRHTRAEREAAAIDASSPPPPRAATLLRCPGPRVEGCPHELDAIDCFEAGARGLAPDALAELRRRLDGPERGPPAGTRLRLWPRPRDL